MLSGTEVKKKLVCLSSIKRKIKRSWLSHSFGSLSRWLQLGWV